MIFKIEIIDKTPLLKKETTYHQPTKKTIFIFFLNIFNKTYIFFYSLNYKIIDI